MPHARREGRVAWISGTRQRRDPRTVARVRRQGPRYPPRPRAHKVSNMTHAGWWNWQGWPLPEERSAWWTLWAALSAAIVAVLTIVLIVIAWRQLSGLAESNRHLATSNELVAESNRALSRPYVVVKFGYRRHMNRDPRAPERATLTIEVSNVGHSPAVNVRLFANPELASTGSIVEDDPAKSRARLFELRGRFDGSVPFGSIPPGQKHTFALDRLPDAMNSEDVPKSYDMRLEYEDVDNNRYRDQYAVSFQEWETAMFDPDPGQRISKDLQAINETLKDRTPQPISANRRD